MTRGVEDFSLNVHANGFIESYKTITRNEHLHHPSTYNLYPFSLGTKMNSLIEVGDKCFDIPFGFFQNTVDVATRAINLNLILVQLSNEHITAG